VSTYDRLKAIITQNFSKNEDHFSLEANYKNDLGFDSFELVIFVGLIEETFGIKVSDEEINGITTVASSIKLIEKHSTKAQ